MFNMDVSHVLFGISLSFFVTALYISHKTSKKEEEIKKDYEILKNILQIHEIRNKTFAEKFSSTLTWVNETFIRDEVKRFISSEQVATFLSNYNVRMDDFSSIYEEVVATAQKGMAKQLQDTIDGCNLEIVEKMRKKIENDILA